MTGFKVNPLGALALILLLGAGPAAAQAANQVFLDATYLAHPTDWCPANAGVPLVIKMDGPNIIEGPKKFPKRVTENKGGTVRRVVTGENTASFNNPEDFGGENVKVIGRFSADFQTCYSPWSFARASGHLRIVGSDGADLVAGKFTDEQINFLDVPLFHHVSGAPNARYASFDGQLFFTGPQPEIKITQTFAAEPDKE